MKLARHLKIGASAAGTFLFGLLFGWVLFPALFKSQLKKEMSLSKKTDVREMWAKLPFPLNIKIYLFNYTNAEDVQSGALPVVEEIGPYFFEQWKEKADLKDHEENDTIDFKIKETFYFKKDLSGPGLTGEEIIIMPHILILTIEKFTSQHPEVAPALEQSYDILFHNPSDIFLRTKAMDILFRGIILNCSTTAYGAKLVCDVCKRQELANKLISLPNNIFKLSFFGSRNGTVDPTVFTAMRGIKNVKDVARLVAVNGKPRLDIWRGECNEFVGTDGLAFPPFNSENDGLTAYFPDFCRSFELFYQKKTSYRGIKTYRYVGYIGDLANDPKQQCFCETPDECPKKGLMDLTKCSNVPIYVSMPHFLDSDPSLLEGIKGLNPDVNLHGIEIDFEPLSGTPLRSRKRLQVNIAFERREDTKLFRQIPNVMAPIFWIEEAVDLNKTYVKMLKYQLFLPKRIVRVVSWLMVLGGVFGMIAASLYHFKDHIMNYVGSLRSTQLNRIKPEDHTGKIINNVDALQATKISD